MMEVGASGISTTESQSHFSLWAISGAPLLAGNDITSMSSTTQAILTNSEVIAVDQDALGLQAVEVSQPATGLQVWSKVLSGSGQRAVALLNRTSSTASITVNWSDIGLTGSASVRDLWAHSTLGTSSTSYTASVPSHGVVLLKISGTEPGVASYEAESSSNTLAGSAVVQNCISCSGAKDVGYIGNGGILRFNGVTVSTSGTHRLVISYIDGDSSTYGIGTYRSLSLSINGGTAFIVSFTATGDWNAMVTIVISVNLSAGSNTLLFSNSSAYGPDLDKIDVV
jgi:Alpha galactosidase C-terminal beta sandwich domain/Alpha galactosidase A